MKNYESALWRKLREAMGRAWLAERIENRLAPGTLDVAFAIGYHSGWIELKSIEEWPSKNAKTVKIRTLTGAQRGQLCRGNSFLLLQTREPEYYHLWQGDAAAALIGVASPYVLHEQALYCSDRLITRNLAVVLTRRVTTGLNGEAAVAPASSPCQR
jgi:hypothetical protein